MGQTLTHGIYLPDEGERNCYSGLAANWQLLDGAVGTIAEHSTQIAGKAPLVHTHTKSDVTDLLNSNFIPSANNSYDLGSSNYQWNNLYAKNYYYNGTAWGLNKANVWSADNIFTYAITIKQTNLEEGVLPTSSQTKRFRFTDKNNANLGWLQHRINTSGDSYLEFYVVNKFSNDQLSTQGSEIANVLNLGLHSDGSRYFTVTGDVYPDLPTRVCNLGTSTNKWKTLNGINPGALSLPQRGSGATVLDVTAWDLTGATDITYTPTFDGWLQLRCKDTDGDFLFVTWGQIRQSVFGRGLLSVLNEGLALTIPVRKDITVNMRCKATANMVATVTPCLGNV